MVYNAGNRGGSPRTLKKNAYGGRFMLQNAKPIWLSGRSTEMNTLAVFRTTLCKKGSAELHVAAASYYRAFLDGRFLGYGPARAAKGYARVDILPF